MTIANLTLAQVRADLQRRLNEVAAAGVWTAAELNGWVNRALLRVYLDLEQDTTEGSINLRQNVCWYALPSDTLLPKFLYGPSIWSNLRLFPTSMAKLDKYDYRWETNTSTISTHFIPFSYDRFLLWPPPQTTTTVTLFYVPMPTTLSADGDTTAIPLQAQKLLPIYGTYLALRKHDFQKAMLFLQEYKQRLEVVKVEIAETTDLHTTKMRPADRFAKAHHTPQFGRRY